MFTKLGAVDRPNLRNPSTPPTLESSPLARPPIVLSKAGKQLVFGSLAKSFKALPWKPQANHLTDYVAGNIGHMSKLLQAELQEARQRWSLVNASLDYSAEEVRATFDRYVLRTMAKNAAPQVNLAAYRALWDDPGCLLAVVKATRLTGDAGLAAWPLAAVCEALQVLHDPDADVRTKEARQFKANFVDACPQGGERERKAYVSALEIQLFRQLPSSTRAQFLDCKREPDVVVRKSRINELLRTKPFALDELLITVDCTDAALEALQILWTAPPVSGVPFARKLTALLASSDDPVGLLRAVEARLLARLQLPDAALAEYRALADAHDTVDRQNCVASLEREMNRIYTRPSKPGPTNPAPENPSQASPLPASVPSPFRAVRRWLEVEQLAQRELSRARERLLAAGIDVADITVPAQRTIVLRIAVETANALVVDGKLSTPERKQFAQRLVTLLS